MEMRKGLFFTVDAVIAATVMLVAIFIISTQIFQSEETTDINNVALDSINALSTIKVYEMQGQSYVAELIANGNITAIDMNSSMLDLINIFWAEGKTTLATNLTRIMLAGVIPDAYNYGYYADDDLLFESNSSSAKNRISYRKFVSGVEEGKTIRGYISKVYFTDIKTKRTSGYLYFGGYVGEGNITGILSLPNNITIISAELEVDAGQNFNLTINGFTVGTYTKGTGGGGYMDPDTWSIGTGYFQDGNNTVHIDFLSSSDNYIGGGVLKVVYDTPLKIDPTTTYYDDHAITRVHLPGIKGIINLYDSLNIPGTLNSLDIHLNYLSNYTTYMTLGNVTLYRNTSEGNFSVNISNSEVIALFAADGYNISDFSSRTLPLRVGLEDIEFIGITGATDTILITDLSGSMDWYADSYRSMISGNIGGSSWRIVSSINFSAPVEKTWTIDDTADWNMGTTTNLTVSGGEISLNTGGSYSEQIEASQTSDSGYTTIYDDYVRGQTFTPSTSGNLTRVELRLRRYGSPPSIEVTIRDSSSNQPGTTVYGTDTRGDISSGSYSNYEFDFSPEIELTGGTTYSIVVETVGNGGSSSNYYLLRRQTYGDYYSGGRYSYSNNNEASWSSLDSYDFRFRTWMMMPGYETSGEVYHTFDASNTVQWHDFTSDDSTPSGTSIAYSFRGSDDAVSWGSWYSDIADVPDTRYIQVRANLQGDGSATPTIDNYEVIALNDTNASDVTTFTVTMQYPDSPDDYAIDMALENPSGSWDYASSDDYAERETTTTGEMQYGEWNVWARETGWPGSIDYTLTVTIPPKRIEVAKDADVLLVNKILNNSNNRVGLVGYRSTVSSGDVEPLTSDDTTLLSEINSYYASGGTCICCGLDRARDELPANGTRFIIVMSDGDATSSCGGDPSQDAIDEATLACADDIRVFSIGFGNDISPSGTATLRNISCNSSDYFNAQNSDDLYAIFNNISQEILGISYTKQSVNLTGDVAASVLYSTSYIDINYTLTSNPLDFGDIFVTADTGVFNNTITNGSLRIPSAAQLVKAYVSSYSAERWTSNVTIFNGTTSQSVFSLADYGSSYQNLGDPYLISIPLEMITRGINNTVSIHTAISPENETNGSVDDRGFYTIVIKNFADSPQVGSLAQGCEWELEFTDGSTTYVKVPSDYLGTDICYYANATYNQNDSVNTAAYLLFSQLDLENNGRLIVKLDNNNMVAELSTVDNVPSLWGPSYAEVSIWK